MNKSVLISIRPEWCEKIASGHKSIEVRKTRPKIETPFKCYIYSCKKGERILARGCEILSGTIFAEFSCSHIEMIRQNSKIALPLFFTETPYIDFFAKSQLTEVELLDYLGDHNSYGWHISDLVIYDHPRKLSEFYCHKPLVRPPMDWCYVEEL